MPHVLTLEYFQLLFCFHEPTSGNKASPRWSRVRGTSFCIRQTSAGPRQQRGVSSAATRSVVFSYVGIYKHFRTNLYQLIHSRGWSVILKRIRKFNLNLHITHTFPHHVDISFSEVGMSDVIDVLHCDRGRNLTVRDALCPYLLLNAFEGEAICCNTVCVCNNQSLYVVP